MPKNKKDPRGGTGRNYGRKLKYGEPTVKVNYRIPESKKPELDDYVSGKLSEWEQDFKQSGGSQGSA